MQRKSKKPSFSFGGMLTFLLLLLLLAGAVLLLIPQYREYHKKRQLEADKRRKLEELKGELHEQMRTNNDLRTSGDAVEKVAREIFHLVGPRDTVLKIPQEKPKEQ